tara:strand:+ start:3628 stop:4089 length:462 start_codon:yes stop_codon:yes gene_type:complete
MAKLNKKLFLNGWILLALILVLGVAGSLYSIPYIEGYKNKNELLENQGNLKCLEEKRYTLLGDWYPVNDPNPQFSDKDQESQYYNYPLLSSSSLYSNNTKYWKEPSNGGCQPPGICGKFYKNIDIDIKKEPNMPPMTDVSNPRVNFYTSTHIE